MTYQTLIVKDTRDVNKCWKWSIILTLLCVVATGLAVTFSFHALLDNFNTNCISGAKLVFKTTTIGADEDGGDDHAPASSAASALSSAGSAETNAASTVEPTAYALSDTPSDTAAAAAATNRGPLRHHQRQNYSEQFREHFEHSGVASMDGTKLGVSKLRSMALASGGVMVQKTAAGAEERLEQQQLDIKFFDSQMIDELNTFWGPMAPCEYISFVPLIEAIVAIVWLAMFMMCGNGGRSNETFVDEPWRIVLPAFVFFALMTVVSAVHLAVLLARLAHFCTELKQHFHDQTVPCALLINQFSINDDFAVAPGQNYVLAITFSWLRLAFWALSVAVMTARCFTGTDFELVELAAAAAAASSGASRAAGGALLNGYTSAGDSGDDEQVAVLSDAEQPTKRSLPVQRVLLTQAGDRTTDDDDDYDVDGGHDGEVISTANGGLVTDRGGGSVVHLNGVEFKPSAQMFRSSSGGYAMRACPAIAEEAATTVVESQPQRSQPGRLQMIGSNCRRLVNEIDQMRESKPKRLKKYLDSKA